MDRMVVSARVSWDASQRGWRATIAGFPACSAVADTPLEALAKVREVGRRRIEAWRRAAAKALEPSAAPVRRSREDALTG